jgi:hypothetical protein
MIDPYINIHSYIDIEEECIRILSPFNVELPVEYDEEENYSFNPDAKWDWWVIGGRWSGFYLGKENASGYICAGHPTTMTIPQDNYYDIIELKDVDWLGMASDTADKLITTWNGKIEPIRLPANEELLLDNYGVLTDDTKESYVIRNTFKAGMTTALVDLDGEWYSDESGWLGLNDIDSKQWMTQCFESFSEAPEDTTLVVVDIHY